MNSVPMNRTKKTERMMMSLCICNKLPHLLNAAIYRRLILWHEQIQMHGLHKFLYQSSKGVNRSFKAR